MSDTPDLLVPDSRIVSFDEAQRQKRNGSKSLFVTKADLAALMPRIDAGISTATLAIGEKVYDQLAGETSVYLEQMEHALMQRINAEFEARSIRGRWRRAVNWFMGYATELGLGQPAFVDIAFTPEQDAEATRAEGLAKLRIMLKNAGPETAIDLPEGTLVTDAQAIEDELRAEREAAVEAATNGA